MSTTQEWFDDRAEAPDWRAASFDDLEIKDGGNVFLFDGYAAVYDQPAELKAGFVEEIRRGAFKSVLEKKPNVPMFHEHHPHQLLATTRSGRMRLEEDSHGLRVRAKLVKTDLSSRVKALVDSGDITGMSYGFVAGRDNQKIEGRSGKPHRLLTGFKRLLDVSTTWDPAFPTTTAQFRARAMQYVDSVEQWEQVFLGEVPQLGEQAHEFEDQETGRRSTDTGTSPRVGGPRLAAAKRRLSLITIELEKGASL